MKSSANTSLLLLLSSLHLATGRDYTRRRLGNQPEPSSTEPNSKSDTNTDYSDSKSFYNLSSLTKREKLQMIQAAFKVNKLSDSIDWDERKDRFRDAVWRDLGGGSSSSRDADHDDEEVDESTDESAGQSVDQQVNELSPDTSTQQMQQQRHLQKSFDGDVFDQYQYSTGACPNPGSLGVPCAPTNLSQLCNKYDRDNGSFRECFQACGPAFCCIHDADRTLNFLAPNCNTDENCPQYNWCYIAWWKMHDTIGPALFLRLEQDDEFYDIEADEIEEDVTNDPVFNQILLHHFDDIQQIIEDGTVVEEDGSSNFNADRIFLDPEYWDTDI